MKETVITNPSEIKEGILDVCQYLRLEMINFLDAEGRNWGKVRSYMNNLKDVFEKMNSKVTEKDMVTYDRVLYLLRPQIYSDFKRLMKKRLSYADCIIVIMKRLLDYSKKIETDDFRFSREFESTLKVITKLYDNIRNHGKEDSLYLMKNLLENALYTGELPINGCQRVGLDGIVHPKEKTRTIEKDSEIVNVSEMRVVSEIAL